MNVKGYVSLDEMIAITENKIKGSIFEILGTEKFLQKTLDNGEITPVYRFEGYIVTQAKVDNNFYGKHENIQNKWYVDGYFRDDHSLFMRGAFSTNTNKDSWKSVFRNLDNNKFILKQNAGIILHINDSKYFGTYEAEVLNRVDSEGKIYLTGWHANLFNEKPVYEGTFGHEDLKDTIIIEREDVYIDIKELSKVLNLKPSAYDLTLDKPKVIKELYIDSKVTQMNKPTDDEPTHHKSVGSMQALVTTLIKMAEYDKADLADPYGELNKLIQAKAEVLGLSVKKDFIAKWLKKADEVL